MKKTKKCKCDGCRKWWPLESRIARMLKGKDAKLFNEYRMHVESISNDLGEAEARLAGEWPGWERLELREDGVHEVD